MSYQWIIEVNGTIIPPSAFLLFLANMVDDMHTRILDDWELPTQIALVRSTLVDTMDLIYPCLKDYSKTRNLTDNYMFYDKRVKRVYADGIWQFQNTDILPEDFYINVKAQVLLGAGDIKVVVTYEEYNPRSILEYIKEYEFSLFTEPVGIPECRAALADVVTMRGKIVNVFA